MRSLQILIMLWVFLAGAIGTGMVGPPRTAIEQEYGLSSLEFGAGVAAIQILSAGAVLVVASRLRRFNPVRVMMVALGFQIAGFAAISGTVHIAGVIVGWALVTTGLVLGAIVNNISMDLWPKNPRRGVVLLHSFNAGGKVTGPLIVAFCLAIGWRYSFLAMGAVTVAVLAFFLAARRSSETMYGDPPPWDFRLGTGAFRKPLFWVIVAAFGMIAGGEAAFASLMPKYFETVRGLSGRDANLLFTVHLLGLVTGRFTSAALAHRLGANATIAVCLAAGVFVIPAVLAGNLLVAAPALFLFGLMFSSTWPSFYAVSAGWLSGHRDMLAYGSYLGSYVGVAVCYFLSSLIAKYNLGLSLFFGPAVLWTFGLVYFASRLSKRPAAP